MCLRLFAFAGYRWSRTVHITPLQAPKFQVCKADIRIFPVCLGSAAALWSMLMRRRLKIAGVHQVMGSCLLPSRWMRLIFLLLSLALPVAPVFAQGPLAAVTERETTIDKMFGMVAPSEPSQLTEAKRFHLYLLSAGGPIPILGEAIGAGVSQWENSPKEWGQGWSAFGQRFGSNLAYNGIRQTITYGTSVVFHEDNRYFASRKHGFWARTGYAALSTVVAQHPDGRRAFSVSSVTGVVSASAISSTWGPSSWEGAENIARNAGISFLTTAGFNIVREFLPDVLHHRRK